MNKEELREYAAKTADEIERRGLAKHTLEDKTGQVCALGGMACAYHGAADYGYEDTLGYGEFARAVADEVNPEWEANTIEKFGVSDFGDTVAAIYTWSDRSTQDEVVAAFRRIAAGDK